jgi:hypothetical protein
LLHITVFVMYLYVIKIYYYKCMYTSLIVGECILLRMYQISKYKQPSFATVLQRALLYLMMALN